jgi:hypothetical protein
MAKTSKPASKAAKTKSKIKTASKQAASAVVSAPSSRWQAQLLLVVALVMIALTGWFAYRATQDADKTIREANNASQVPPADTYKPPVPDPKLPAGYVQYDGSDLGVRFAYPQAWGSVKREKGPETAHLAAGSEWTFSFSDNSAVTAGMRSADWRHVANLSHDGAPNATNYSKSGIDSFSNSSIFTILNDQSFIVDTPLTGIGCHGVASVLVSKLDNRTTYPGIAFVYVEKQASGTYDDPICKPENYKQYLNPEHHAQLLEMSKHIQAVY